jgi:LmbE family N-acetylglucosaminyl deacetylase
MNTRFRLPARIALAGAGALLLSAVIWAGSDDKRTEWQKADPNLLAIDLDRGAAGLSRCLMQIRTRASVLMVTAHPDDEDGGLLTYQTRGVGARGTLLTLNRGEGGQNAMSVDMYDALGLLRTQELLAADRYYGVDQYWTSVIDYGFSKTREEALQKWGHDRVLGEVVRVVRMTHPLILASVFAGAPTDGHGNHQVAGQMAQEAFVAAGDPTRFPEQLKEGLRPWKPLKVYARVPFFEATKEGIYDYATDKYVPVRFFDYVHRKWIEKTPEANVNVSEGDMQPATGLTFLQMGRDGLGQQKSQNGGVTIPPPALISSAYHRYGSRVDSSEHEKSMYDGMDVSLPGIASLATGQTEFLKAALERIQKTADEAVATYKPGGPAEIAPVLADGLRETRALLQQVAESSLSEPGKNDVEFELKVKEQQFENALALALQLSFDATIAPEKEPTGARAFFGGPALTSLFAIPAQSLAVKTHVLNSSAESVKVESIEVAPTDGKSWSIRKETPAASELPGGKDTFSRFALKVPENATLTRPYFSRPDEEQPYYNLDDPRFENLSLAPYPLVATARISYRGTELTIRKYVQTMQRVEGIGIEANPLLVGPALSVQVSPAAGAVPLDRQSFTFSCTLHSNVKGAAKGILRLQLPAGWTSAPSEYPFTMQRDGDTQTIAFEVLPRDLKQGNYEIKAVAEYQGKKYEEGYRMVGYAGLRSYPYYRPATYKAVGVDVKTAAGLRVAFVPGTGDEVPRSLEDLGVSVRIINANDLESASLRDYDAVVLGVRAYAVQSSLRSSNSRLLEYVKNGGVLIVQYNLQNFDGDYGPYPFSLGSNAAKVVDEGSDVKILDARNPILNWPNRVTASDFANWQEERGHGFMAKWDSHYEALVETHDPDQPEQSGGLLIAHYGKGIYIYDAYALYRQLPAGVPGAYRILANLVSAGKNPAWK